ncbi:MAG TPA: 1-deoxy-D-xylulose-5-phosphate reductoisomerase [Desulfobacteraceae bacterium]|nr:1-deoxy-D-xylulose-5-phosphate reductoisomerase [Desulfobacteraceae bacterium]
MKNIAILGSTGSIGVSALKVIRDNPDKYNVVALAAGRNIELLNKQINDFRPILVAVMDDTLANDLSAMVQGDGSPEILSGVEGLVCAAALDEADTVISAMSGGAGLLPTYEAIKAGKDIALANKETMVMAGSIIMKEAEKRGVSVLPIDSEHSAILQSLRGHFREDIRHVILTASGGPFRSVSLAEMDGVTPAQALNHPNWDMGPKISVDSATMMNKGFEVIEAKWLFDLEMDQIFILIHPQSIVHSMVEYRDGSIIAQLGIPDMRTPISYALSYPRHYETRLEPLNLDQIKDLSFKRPDFKKFKCLELAFRAAEIGDSMPIVLNGANEVAVESFLQGGIKFLDISNIIEKTMEYHQPVPVDDIEEVMAVDRWARQAAADVRDAGF